MTTLLLTLASLGLLLTISGLVLGTVLLVTGDVEEIGRLIPGWRRR
jgi:hypothetical protein